ncbi:GreA/GreB family elongation factor [Cyclobacterium jeungdonense]|uniref:GreA/GreB family elongation factor n=1 Tax=Cyclobacterium jeungdonense TaxID=708087 RepID=A0ABT8C8K4_9BACT|nr:GreA/GreB family elongation factor [Cyclobacterium jeungdonense]MDN3689124.1 GreA/GreB family elongation factor [Cyclobacterium jeungdonense]
MLPIIKTSDVDIIFTLVNHLNPNEKTKEVRQLVSEIQKAKKVTDAAMPQKVIQLNSYFEVKFEKNDQLIAMTLVLPENADLASSKLSLFSPLGVALIGYKEGDRVDWPLPVGRRIIQILKVKNPEAVPVS